MFKILKIKESPIEKERQKLWLKFLKKRKNVRIRSHPLSKNLWPATLWFHGHLFQPLRGIFRVAVLGLNSSHVFTFPWGSELTASIPGLRALVHLGSGAVYCVEVAESRVISNNTITPNNRVYRTRPAYASGSITFIFHHCVLPAPGYFVPVEGKIDTLSTEVTRTWLEIDQIFILPILFEIVTCLSLIYIYRDIFIQLFYYSFIIIIR